jgi:hypothetical protein
MRRYLACAILNRRCILVLFVAALSACRMTQSPEKQRGSGLLSLSVCDVLQDPSRYRGKVVTVTGIYWNGLCQSCPNELVTGNKVWPSALNLSHSDTGGEADEVLRFKTNDEAFDRLMKVIRREAMAGRREEIWLTVVGQIRAPREYVLPDGSLRGGYGHLGVFPAELVIQSISDISIRPNPTYDYGELLKHIGPR